LFGEGKGSERDDKHAPLHHERIRGHRNRVALLSFIAVAIIAVVSNVGGSVSDLYQSVYEKVAGVSPD
jgi:hypothetical protein